MRKIKTYSQFINESLEGPRRNPYKTQGWEVQKYEIEYKEWYELHKPSEVFSPIEEWEDILKAYGIKNYTINYDTKTVDVDGAVIFENVSKIPVQFGKVTGDFGIINSNSSYNVVKSLIGCPEYVGGGFKCEKQDIKYFTGGPKYVGKNYIIHMCPIENTISEGLPLHVGGTLTIMNCKLRSLNGFSDIEIGGDFKCHFNYLTSLEGCPKSIGGNTYQFTHNQLTSLVFAPKDGVLIGNNPCEDIYDELGFTTEAHIKALKTLDPNPEDTIQRLKKYNPGLAKELSLEFGLESEELTNAYNTSKNVEGDFY